MVRLFKFLISGISSVTKGLFSVVSNVINPNRFFKRSYSWDKGVGQKYSIQSVALLLVLAYGLSLLQLVGVDAGSGEIEHYSAKRTTQQSGTPAGWTAVTGTADTGTTASTNGWIDSANLTAGERYLILAFGNTVGGAAGDDVGLRVTHGGTSFTESEDVQGTDPTSLVRNKPYAWFTVWTAVASEDLEVQMYAASGDTVYANDITLVAINAESLISNGDLQYDIDTTGGTLTTTPTAQASVTWTPDNHNDAWWVFSYAQNDVIDDTGTDSFEAQLDVDGTIRGTAEFAPLYGITNTPQLNLGWAGELDNSSTTVEIELSESAADQEWDSAGVMALRLNGFESYAYTYNSATEVLNTFNTYEEVESIDPEIFTTGDVFLVGGMSLDDNGAQGQMKLQEGTTDLTDEVGGYNYTANDIWGGIGAEMFIDETTGVKDYNMDAKSLAGTTAEAEHRWLVSFSMERDNNISGTRAQVRDVSTGFTADANNDYSVTTPTGTAEGDLLVLYQHHGRGDMNLESEWGQSGSGFTFQFATADGSPNNESQAVWTRTATAGDAGGSGSYTFNTTIGSDAVRWYMVAVKDHNGLDTTEDYNDTDVTSSPSISDSITPTEDGALLLTFMSKDQNSGSTSTDWEKIDETSNLQERHTNEGNVLYTAVWSESLNGTSAVTREFDLQDGSISGSAKMAMVTINPSEVAPSAGLPEITQRAYIWENDNEDLSVGDSVDENAQLAAGDTALTSVRKGERLTLRTQIDNTGAGSLDSTDDLALFYDQGDGYWTRVENSSVVNTSSGSCSNTDFECTVVASTNDVGHFTSLATNPVTGLPRVAYHDGAGGENDVQIADYVGIGGNCASSEWQCSDVVTTGLVGNYSSITFDNDGKSWIAYANNSVGNSVFVAQEVGSGGSGCAVTTWDCEEVADPANDIGYIDIASDGTDPWVSFIERGTGEDIWVANYVGSGGDCDSVAGGSDEWECTEVHTSGSIHNPHDIAIDADGNPWLAYERGTDLYVAEYVGGGSGTGCADSNWTCTAVWVTGTPGGDISMAFGPDGNPWVAHVDDGSDDLLVSRYVGSGGNCDGSYAGSDAWDCWTVATTQTVDTGTSHSIAISPAGIPHIVFQDGTGTNADLEMAVYVGSGGSCNDSAWDCIVVNDTTDELGQNAAVTFDATGNLWISHHNQTDGDLEVARFNRGGEITIASSESANTGDGHSESHADMTSATDTTNRDDVDCVGSGGAEVFNTGRWSEQTLLNGVSLPAGDTNLQCTEVSWVLDTSQAVEGQTYRFVIATSDSIQSDRSPWRGPVSVVEYPTLTIESETTARYAKGVAYNPSTDCSNTDYTCEIIMNGSQGANPEIIFDDNGDAWVTTYGPAGGALYVGRYVGTGGSGCVTSSWECWEVESDGLSGAYSSLALKPDGTVVMAFQHNASTSSSLGDTGGGIMYAEYVGTGGTGCDSATFDCTLIDDSSNDGRWNAIGVDDAGTPWVMYNDGGDVTVAWEVGTGGDCPDSTAWECETLEDNAAGTNNTTVGSDVLIGNDGVPRFIYSDFQAGEVVVAEYVGAGGNCDASTVFNCTVAFDVASGAQTAPGLAPTATVDSDGDIWIAGYDTNGDDLVVAEYVGSGGDCDTVGYVDTGSDAYECYQVHSTGISGREPSIQIGPDGNPAVAYAEGSPNFETFIARYVGSGGDCDSSFGGDDAWNCERVDTNAVAGDAQALAFDDSGAAWIPFYHQNNVDLMIAVEKQSSYPLGDTFGGGDRDYAVSGDAQYRLDDGRTPRSDPAGDCDSIALDNEGYCAHAARKDGNFDTVAGESDESPIFTYAQKTTNNNRLPSASWFGESTDAPDAAGTDSDIVLEVYRYGTTNDWEEIGRNSLSEDCDGTECFVGGRASGTVGEYYLADGSDYWVNYRVYQVANGSSPQTLKTDFFGPGGAAIIDQAGFIWENDDRNGASTTSTQLAAGDTNLELVRKGTTLTLRTQIENSGGPLGGSAALYYDKGDGIWSRAQADSKINPDTASGCDAAEWLCEEIITSVSGPTWNDVAIDPNTGYPVVAYHNEGSDDLWLMTYAPFGDGSGCSSSDWSCTLIDDSSADIGEHASIAIGSDGRIGIAYHDETNSDLRIAFNTFDGETPFGCGSNTTWICYDISNVPSDDSGSKRSVDAGFGPNQQPWVAYYNNATGSVSVARYAGTGNGSGCTSVDWICEQVDNTATVTGVGLSLAVDSTGTPWIAYQNDTDDDLVVAVRDGGNSGCSDADWSCEDVDVTDSTGNQASIAIGPDDRPWVAWRNATDGDLIVGRRTATGSGGTCDDAGFGGSDAWECEVVHAANDSGKADIKIAPDGNPWVAYRDETDNDLWLAKYRGDGSGTGCESGGSTDWDCELIESTGGPGNASKLGFDHDGNAWIYHHDGGSAQFEVARTVQKGEIQLIDSRNTDKGASITTSHADMTSVTDSVNRNDADCLTGGAEWNDGRHVGASFVPVSLKSGLDTVQCTELTWTIDTSNAVIGETYRFAVAFETQQDPTASKWIGPTTITEYPQITITEDVGARIAKGSTWIPDGSCTSSDYSCEAIITSGDVGESPGIGFHPETGYPWIVYRDVTNLDLEVAIYVGAGNGTGCAIDEFTCYAVDTSGDVGGEAEIAFGPDGTAWISYLDNGSDDGYVAHYVGNGEGTGCASSEWTCEDVYDVSFGTYGFASSSDIEVHPKTGQPWVVFSDDGNPDATRVGYRVGNESGAGCNDPNWTCETVNTSGNHGGITFNDEGLPVVGISTGQNIEIATRVGGNGDCFGTQAGYWECTNLDLDFSFFAGFSASPVFAPDGTLWFGNSEWSVTPSLGRLNAIEYVGGGTGSCSNTDYDCTTVDSGNNPGNVETAYSSDGVPTITYTNDDPILGTAKYVGSGGDCTSSEWECTTVESFTNSSVDASGVYDENDVHWIVYYDPDDDDLKIANNALSTVPLSADKNTAYGKFNVNSGGDAQYRLDPGVHPQNTSACTANASYEGYCGIRNGDGAFDSIQVLEGERPIYTYAYRVDTNTEAPTIEWTLRTDLAPNSSGDDGDLHLEIYRFGTTNAWESLASDTTASNCDTQDCTISGMPTGTLSEYFETDGSEYWVHIRAYQIEGTSPIDLRVDSFDSFITGGRLRGGQNFEDEARTPFR